MNAGSQMYYAGQPGAQREEAVSERRDRAGTETWRQKPEGKFTENEIKKQARMEIKTCAASFLMTHENPLEHTDSPCFTDRIKS